MINLAQIVERIDARIRELGTTAAEVSARATDSKDTIRNWARAVEADRLHGTNKASATTIKLNQVEVALGIELARNSPAGPQQSAEDQLRSALLAFGVDAGSLSRVLRLIRAGFVNDHEGQSEQTPPDDQREPASPHRAEVP